MDFFLSRYRTLTVLLIVIAGQLLLIAYQVKTNTDVPLIRVWAVTAVTPAEQVLEIVRRYTWGFVEDYFVLLGVQSENAKLKHENGELKIENHYLKAELATADRARALSVFQAHSPSTTLAARVIGNGTGANSKVVFVDRGSASGVESGMAVVTPDGIVGKVVDAYPTASLIMLITDPTFAAGVVSQKNHVHGTLKGQGHSECLIDYVQNEEPVEVGEWFFTSGDDRIFPRGFPVGQVSAAHSGKDFKEIYVTPSGMQGGVEEVLIVLQGVHEQIPEQEIASPDYKILQPPADVANPASLGTALATDADRLRQIYKQSGEEQKHVYGEGVPGSKPPDFTKIPSLRGGTTPAANPKPLAASQPVAPGGASNSPAGSTSLKPTAPMATATTDVPAKAVSPTAPPPTKSSSARGAESGAAATPKSQSEASKSGDGADSSDAPGSANRAGAPVVEPKAPASPPQPPLNQ